jgi:hypothetical protein
MRIPATLADPGAGAVDVHILNGNNNTISLTDDFNASEGIVIGYNGGFSDPNLITVVFGVTVDLGDLGCPDIDAAISLDGLNSQNFGPNNVVVENSSVDSNAENGGACTAIEVVGGNNPARMGVTKSILDSSSFTTTGILAKDLGGNSSIGGNRVTANGGETAIEVSGDTQSTMAQNRLTAVNGGNTGIRCSDGASPSISGNNKFFGFGGTDTQVSGCQ